MVRLCHACGILWTRRRLAFHLPSLERGKGYKACGMYITLKSANKFALSVELGRTQPEAQAAGYALDQLEWDDVRCGACRFGTRFEDCAAVRSCAGIFGYFCDVVSFGHAEAVLSCGEDRLDFSGSAQCVAAFAILACMVYSECGRAAPYSFLLEHFHRVQGQADGSAFFGNVRSCLEPRVGRAQKPNRESWYELFDTLIRRKVVSVLGIYDNGGLNDTLRNACQILYSISSLALDELHSDQDIFSKTGPI